MSKLARGGLSGGYQNNYFEEEDQTDTNEEMEVEAQFSQENTSENNQGCRRNNGKEDDFGMNSTFVSFYEDLDSQFNEGYEEMDMWDEEGFEVF